jgi:hypothetical protein
VTSLPSGERELYRDRLRAPRSAAVILLVFFEAVAVAAILIGHASAGNAAFGLVMATVIPIGIGVWAELGSRRVWFIVGERTLKLGRVPAFPASAVRDFELLDGKQAVDRARSEIRGDSTQWNQRTKPNPNLRGSLAANGAENAVLIHVDPHAARIPTDTFLIGTRRPEALMAALREATRAAAV